MITEGQPASLREAVTVAWLVRGCTSWQVFMGGPLWVDLPIQQTAVDDVPCILYCGASAVIFPTRSPYIIRVGEQDQVQDLDFEYFESRCPFQMTVGLPWAARNELVSLARIR